MTRTSSRPGYVFLLAVLGVGVITATTSLSLMLLGWAAEQNGAALEQSAQALGNAQACVERALFSLREDPGYGGSESVTFQQGSCVIEPIVGVDNTDRALCVTGRSGASVRRLEVDIEQLLPVTQIRSWREQSIFTLCP